jgi:hypothetical protein
MSELLEMEGPRKRYAGMMSGLAVHYDLGEGHPLLGRRMPDLDISTAYSTRRVFSLLHAARPVLINFGTPDSVDLAGWSEEVRWLNASYAGAWELPVIGAVTSPSAVLVRPDGYVAWVGNGTEDGLHEALLRWCGPPKSV